MKVEIVLPNNKEISETEHKEYCASIFAIFPRLEKDIKEEMYSQLVSGYTNSDNWDKILKYQGILEGMAILLEKWRLASIEFEAKDKEEGI